MRLKISVTAQDIQRGKHENIKRCPVARAIRRALKGRRVYVAVEPGYVVLGAFHRANWDSMIDARTITLPLRVRQWVWDFDGNKPVKPFSFTITGVSHELV